MEVQYNKIQDSIDEINLKINTIEGLLKKAFKDWTNEEIEEYSSKDYLREKEKILREEKNKLMDEKLILLNKQKYDGKNNYLNLLSLTIC